MRRTTVLLAVVVLCAASVEADRHRAVATPDPNAISVEFVEVPATGGTMTVVQNDAWLDVGRFFKRDLREHGVHVRRDVGLRLLRAGTTQWGTARLTARLQSIDGRTSVRVDGQLLTTTPTLIDARRTIGPLVVHHIDIAVPDSATAGPLATTITWEATTDP